MSFMHSLVYFAVLIQYTVQNVAVHATVIPILMMHRVNGIENYA